MKNLKLKNILFLVLSACSFQLSARGALAQNVDIGIYPPIMQVDTTSPADAKSTFTLENLSDQSVDINISYKAFKPADSEDGQVEILDNFSSFPDPLFANRIKILDSDTPIDSITLSPKQKKNLNLEIKIPNGEEKGDYYFLIIFNSRPSSSIFSNSSLASGGVAMNVLLSVGPKGPTQGFIKNFSSPFFVNSGPVGFKVELENTSDHFISPTGNIVIKNIFGQEIGKVDLLPVNILSDSVRLIPDSIQANSGSKDYAKIQSMVEKSDFPVAVWPEKFLIGPYTATLNVSLSDTGPVFKKSVLFFAFPITYLLALILILVITIFIILRVKRKIN